VVDTPDPNQRPGTLDAGLPVGRTVSSGGASPGGRSAASRLPSWVIPALVLSLVAGFGVGLAVGMLTGGSEDGQAATTTTPGATTTTTIAWEPADAYGAAVTITGTALPVLDTQTAGAVDTAIGMAFPGISGTDYEGNARAITADGRAKVIVALAHWCPYCNAEMPVLQQWYAESLPGDVDVVALSIYADPFRANFPPRAWLREASWALPTIADDESRTIVATLGIPAVPFWVLVSADGTVLGRVTGQRDAAGLDQLLQALAGQG